MACHRIAGCEVVGLCDREVLMASQLGERFGIPACFSDAAEMLRVVKPDVVHITTPPQGHFLLAEQCLEAGCHVYLEKPFTVTAPEAVALIRLAEAKGSKITAGHNLQFTLEMLQMRQLVAQNFLGGKPVHLESHFSYDLGDTSYVGPLLGNRNHWVRQLPGQLLHNILSHGIAKLCEFLDDDLVEIIATAQQSAQLQRLGGREILDELRVLIRDASGTTAFFCFSTQLKPGLNLLRICGPANAITVDHTSGTMLRHENRSYKSYLTFFVPPLRNSKQHFCNAWANFSSFLSGRLHQDSGMRELVARFYDCIQMDEPPPIPYREILLTARIMDAIFAQIYQPGKSDRPAAPANGAVIPVEAVP